MGKNERRVLGSNPHQQSSTGLQVRRLNLLTIEPPPSPVKILTYYCKIKWHLAIRTQESRANNIRIQVKSILRNLFHFIFKVNTIFQSTIYEFK